jgi:hypothetical protein
MSGCARGLHDSGAAVGGRRQFGNARGNDSGHHRAILTRTRFVRPSQHHIEGSRNLVSSTIGADIVARTQSS